MRNQAERSRENPFTTEIKEKEREFLEDREARLRNQSHLEKAYEWLRSRGKTVPLAGRTDSP